MAHANANFLNFYIFYVLVAYGAVQYGVIGREVQFKGARYRKEWSCWARPRKGEMHYHERRLAYANANFLNVFLFFVLVAYGAVQCGVLGCGTMRCDWMRCIAA